MALLCSTYAGIEKLFDVAKERNKEAVVALLENPPPPVAKTPAIAIAALEESLKEVVLD